MLNQWKTFYSLGAYEGCVFGSYPRKSTQALSHYVFDVLQTQFLCVENDLHLYSMLLYHGQLLSLKIKMKTFFFIAYADILRIAAEDSNEKSTASTWSYAALRGPCSAKHLSMYLAPTEVSGNTHGSNIRHMRKYLVELGPIPTSLHRGIGSLVPNLSTVHFIYQR